MGLTYRRRIRLPGGLRMNVSKSGVSFSEKIGPVTLNSRGRGSVRLARGVSYRFGGTTSAASRRQVEQTVPQQPRGWDAPGISPKVTFWLALTLGWIGGHRFYMGQPVLGLLYACTGGLFVVGWLVDALRAAGRMSHAPVEAPVLPA